jgi:hypothetical protein
LLAKGLNSSSSLTSLYPTSLPTISFQRGGWGGGSTVPKGYGDIIESQKGGWGLSYN